MAYGIEYIYKKIARALNYEIKNSKKLHANKRKMPRVRKKAKDGKRKKVV